jgi:hypothetical protein
MNKLTLRCASILLGLSSFVVFHGSTCVMVYCSENCDPCVTQCQCHTCPHPQAMAFEPAHRLVSFERACFANADGSTQETFAWIGGLLVANATGRSEITAKDLREFAEGVLGVNRELLDLPASLGRWEFAGVDLAQEYELVSFVRRDARSHAGPGSLAFVFDAHGKLLEIDRTLPGP